ncbi:hypothetical protein [Agromyces larvae]|uniref:Transposase n=1 Tax=Agromyces larvae TaxID=2929802 RepID=A0ABY4BV76_9MICO|nr:hypothetical protein [Agromyces larvae]UOE43084.1 hypothetical protein MTO99_12905 [Agromyces larvae]
MPKRMPLSRALREAVADAIRDGGGRNATARQFGISPGSVTNIAREFHLWFENDWQTTTTAEAHRIGAAVARLEKEDQLINQLLTTSTIRLRDGRETKAHRRISYALYNLRRHHG